jgi:vacuole morphology and inheritance protein 14
MLLPQSSAFAALKNRLNSVSAIGYLHIANYSASSSGAPRTYVSSQISNFHLRKKSRENTLSSNSASPSQPHFSSLLLPFSLITSNSFTSPASQNEQGYYSNQSLVHDRTGPGGSSTSASSVVSSFEGRPNRLKSREDAQQGIRWVELLEKFRTVQERARRATRSNPIFGGVQGGEGGAFEGGYGNDGMGPPPAPLKEKNVQVIDGRGLPRSGTPTGARPGGVGGATPGQGGQRPSKVGLGLGRFGGGVGGKKAKR